MFFNDQARHRLSNQGLRFHKKHKWRTYSTVSYIECLCLITLRVVSVKLLLREKLLQTLKSTWWLTRLSSIYIITTSLMIYQTTNEIAWQNFYLLSAFFYYSINLSTDLKKSQRIVLHLAWRAKLADCCFLAVDLKSCLSRSWAHWLKTAVFILEICGQTKKFPRFSCALIACLNVGSETSSVFLLIKLSGKLLSPKKQYNREIKQSWNTLQ